MAQRSPFKGQRFLETKYLLKENLRESPQPPQPSPKSSFASRQGRIHKGKTSACTGTAEIPSFEASLPATTTKPTRNKLHQPLPGRVTLQLVPLNPHLLILTTWRTGSWSFCMLLLTEEYADAGFC